MSRRTIWRLVGAGVLALFIAGIAAPYVRADRYGEEIRNELQRALGRKVENFQSVTFNLFTGPGFTVNDVVIYDDPSAGIEPFARMDSLEARISLTSLLFGKLEFSTVRLVEPSINLVKRKNVSWNIVPLLERAPARGAVSLPEIQVSGGRFNFKFDDIKSAFYLSNADVTISRTSTPGTYQVRFYGEPARTDKAARGFGSLRGRGTWVIAADSRLDLNLELERSGIDEIATLIRGDAVGVHGAIASRVHISGPVSKLNISGQLQMEDVHRWDLMQARTGGWTLNVKGLCDLRSQTLELAASPDINPGVPVSGRLLVFGILAAPRWSAGFSINGLPVPVLIEVARHMGAPLPGGLNVDGNVTGSVDYINETGFSGSLQLQNARLRVGKNSQMRIPQASVLVSSEELRLLPSVLVGDAGQEASVEAVYTPATAEVEATVTGRGLRVSDLNGESGGLLGGGTLPLSEHFGGGIWNGTLRYFQPSAAEGTWTGEFNVRNTSTVIPGMAEPVKLSAASVLLESDRLAVKGFRASIGNIECFGEYRYEPALDRPHRVNISVIAADMSELERLFLPTLRRQGNFLARTLRFRQPSVPDWLRERRAEGTVRVGTLTIGETVLRAVRSHIVWTGGAVQFGNVSAKLEDGTLAGVATANLTGREPRYGMRGGLQNWTWHGGKLDLNGQLTSSGVGTDLLLSLTSEGGFQARAVAVAPDYVLRTASGTFEVSIARTGPQIKLASLQAAMGSERFSGEGGTQLDGRLNIDLASPSRTMRLTGLLTPLHLEVTERPTAR